MFAFGQTVTRLRAPLVADVYSAQSTKRDWVNAASVAIAGFAIDPGGSVEFNTVNRRQITTTPTLYFQGSASPDILASDRVTANGVTWEVVGNVADWRSPFTGWAPGFVWPLQRVEG
jgi:hypothetical protein